MSSRPLNTIMSPDKLKPWIRIGDEQTSKENVPALEADVDLERNEVE